ncbi:MAG TPA: delta-60 repeat domain-containing protein, partial [Fibrella sp.]
MRNIFTPLLLLSFIATNAQDGTLDPSFGTGGLVSTYPNGNVNPDRQKVTVVSGDKIYQCYSVSNGTNNDFGLVRYNSDGTLDNTFDGDGIVRTDFGGDDGATSMFVQADGKIVVAGYSIVGGNGVFAVARYNTNGSLDNTFDTDGRVTTAIGTDDAAYSVSLQSDGRIVVGGRSRFGTNYVFSLVRYNTNGSLDNTFDTDGRVTTDIGVASGVDAVYSIAIQNDGRIVAAGSSFNGTSITYFALARYNTNGSLDNTFEYDGTVLTSLTANGNDAAYAVTIQTDGRIIAAGSAYNGTNFDLGLVRYTSTGFLDNSFDGDGRVITNLPHNGSEEINAIGQQSNGKILVAGYTDYGFSTQRDFVVARYNADGSPDGSFGSGGHTIIDFGGDDIGYSLDSQGLNLIVGGTSGTSLAIARLLNSSMILPVSLTTFTAEKRGSGVQLTWETVNERQTDAFEIERSADGVNFTSIGTVTASGNSSSVRNYTFTDAQPLQSINFYRLKIVNSDRSVNYSRIVTVRFSGAAITLQAFPNPV